VSFDHYVLLWLLALPAGMAIVVAFLGEERGKQVRIVSLATSLVTLVLALVLAGRFMALVYTGAHPSPPDGAPVLSTFQPEFVPGSTEANPHQTRWNLVPLSKGGAIQFFLGVDGLNIWLVVLTAVLFLPSVLVSWTHVTERVHEFFAWLLVLQTCVMGVFLAFDIIIFYTFFELSLVPLFFLIGIWGGPQRRYAAFKFFVYTLVGSLLALLGILGVVLACYDKTGEMTFSIPRLVELVHLQLKAAEIDPATKAYWARQQHYVFPLLALGFAVKVPLVPLHTWLPLAHVEAPTAGSVDLAGVLLKIGAYGFLRLCIPLAPDASLNLGLPVVSSLAAIGIVWGSFCAYSQSDVKRLIAYSSVGHLGLCMLAMFSLTAAGISGSVLQMINHGLSTGALFLLIGMLYERYHTRDLNNFGGMAARLPLFGAFMVFATMTSIGLPGLNGFVGEFLCIAGIAQREWTHDRGWILTITALSGVLLGAWYMITMLRRLLFGPVKEPHHEGPTITDLKPREWLLLAPIAVLCVLIGVYPQPMLKSIQPDVDRVVIIANLARERAGRAPSEGAGDLIRVPKAEKAAGER